MRIRNILAVTLVAVALAATACSSTRTQRAPGEHVDDAVLLTSVKSALARDKSADAHEINVEVNRGIVQLNGFVDSAEEKSAATAAASRVKGVKEVRNNLMVNKGERKAGEVFDDALLTTKVKTALIGNRETKAHQITVKTLQGVVQLGGFVDSAEAKAAATTVAMSVTGVKSVDNQLSIKTKQ
jgi:hyperosmotically inducible protein